MTTESDSQAPVERKSLLRRVGIYAAVLVAVFLIGFIPMWLKARSNANKLAETEHQLTLLKLQDGLASAVIMSRRGDYEPARQAASEFFTSLGSEVNKELDSNLSQAQKDSVKPLLARRDDVITLLARGDPAASDRLSDLYVAYQKIMNS